MTLPTVAQRLAAAFVKRGVPRVFGIPGGGSSLDLIRACGELNLPFVLARTETAAVIMAAVTAEMTGKLGVALVTQGPGTASATNGVAYASLDRAPVMLLSDGWTAKHSFDSHQRFDQAAVLRPLIKDHDRLEGDAVAAIERLIDAALAPPRGPVYVELTAENARRASADGAEAAPSPAPVFDRGALEAARALIARADRPVVLVGLEAKMAPEAVRSFADALACPVLTTYKGKGAISADHPNLVGLFTGATAERACVQEADLIVMLGLDPVELIGRPWAYTAPVVEIAAAPSARVFVAPEISVQGPLAETLAGLRGGNRSSLWTAEQIRGHRDAMRARLAYRGNGKGLSPDAVVAEAAAVANCRARATVDAGAHMVSATTLWPARAPGDLAISNGLSTMGFALPAAIALSLQDRTRPVIAFTGDGGIMMCLGELSTAVQEHARICVVVFNDASLSLIELKQRARKMPREGVDFPPPDFAPIARGFGLTAWTAGTVDEYRAALVVALAHDGPTLIDVAVDPTGYGGQLAALRN